MQRRRVQRHTTSTYIALIHCELGRIVHELHIVLSRRAAVADCRGVTTARWRPFHYDAATDLVSGQWSVSDPPLVVTRGHSSTWSVPEPPVVVSGHSWSLVHVVSAGPSSRGQWSAADGADAAVISRGTSAVMRGRRAVPRQRRSFI